jgi:hypothetical protein
MNGKVFWLLLVFSWSVVGMDKREPNSPKGDYQFSLKEIQATVRDAVILAEKRIAKLQEENILADIAEAYFHNYLDNIGKYNQHYPLVEGRVEAYKTDLVNAYVLAVFKQRYPKLIFDQSKWMFNSVGGIYANMIILYCSRTEYIVLWGTTLASHGVFSGYYPFMNEFDVMTRGRMLSHDVDAPGHAAVIYEPIKQDGVNSETVDTSNLIPGNVRSYTLQPYTYMVSYAQGNMAKAFVPGAIMPGIFVNQDWGGMFSHFSEALKSYFAPNKEWQPWREKANYRPIWIIDVVKEQLAAQSKKS